MTLTGLIESQSMNGTLLMVCPACGTHLEFDGELAPHLVTCPNCQAEFSTDQVRCERTAEPTPAALPKIVPAPEHNELAERIRKVEGTAQSLRTLGWFFFGGGVMLSFCGLVAALNSGAVVWFYFAGSFMTCAWMFAILACLVRIRAAILELKHK